MSRYTDFTPASTPFSRVIKNLKAGLVILEAAPEERFNLNWFAMPCDDEGEPDEDLGHEKWSCGTLACAAGWIAVDDKRLSLHGMSVDELGEYASHLCEDEGRFGPASYTYLFVPAEEGHYDAQIYADLGQEISDKALALERFKRRIAELEAA